ncbi:MAG: metallophosphoesterase [Rhodospirillaceae bacterium]|nr:metallophosphoesterase [Rhodospirillaceae bacterium]MBT7732515.1 metallophosphoesterase [Rhodospirillaceae bacterium]
MQLLAISDLHLSQTSNKEALIKMADHRDDWLIIGGDTSEKPELHEFAFKELSKRFGRLIWVPGNHDLWTFDSKSKYAKRGVEKYNMLVEIARSFGVITPEDPFLEWPEKSGNDAESLFIAPLFLLYDYSFRPKSVDRNNVKNWVREVHAECSDEILLDPKPYKSREEWCWERCDMSTEKLSNIPETCKTILINHWPLRLDLINLPRVPRFTPWCGTHLTHDWHNKFRANVVISGHLHTRRTDFIDDCRFEEVSLGYRRQWDLNYGIDYYLRTIIAD